MSRHTPGPRVSYSVHDIDHLNDRGRKVVEWVVIEEELDEAGEIVDTELLAVFKTHEAALRRLARLEDGEACTCHGNAGPIGTYVHAQDCPARAALARAKGETK